MFMYIFTKYAVIFGYIANYLTKIDGINLRFPQKENNLLQTWTYPIAVLSFIVQWSGLQPGAQGKLVIIEINISMFFAILHKLIRFGISLDLQDNINNREPRSFCHSKIEKKEKERENTSDYN